MLRLTPNEEHSSLNFIDKEQLDVINTDLCTVILKDCIAGMKGLEDNSIHLIITDPPYFIDGLDSTWDKKKIDLKKSKGKVVTSLPVGMKFDPKQGKEFQLFMDMVSREAFRVLKPGGFFISFSQARLYHRLAIAAEDNGFEIRDMLAWKYEGQAKAFSQDHFVRKNDKLSESEKETIISKLMGRKTPQLKPQIEPMILAQKPKCGTFVQNWLEHETGLISTDLINGKFPGNVFEVKKPTAKEKGFFNDHLTIKPIYLIEQLIKIFSIEGQIVLDPFMGSGTTAIACINQNRRCIGFEKNSEHMEICAKRIHGRNTHDK